SPILRLWQTPFPALENVAVAVQRQQLHSKQQTPQSRRRQVSYPFKNLSRKQHPSRVCGAKLPRNFCKAKTEQVPSRPSCLGGSELSRLASPVADCSRTS